MSSNNEITNWGLTEEQQKALDQKIREVVEHQIVFGEPEWMQISFKVPSSFKEIVYTTLAAYMMHLETDKTFPALEALFLEARNSLPNEILSKSGLN